MNTDLVGHAEARRCLNTAGHDPRFAVPIDRIEKGADDGRAMPDILAIISKAIFEEQARKGKDLLGPGEVLALDRYVSKNKGLSPLSSGGRLVLVTVRPPNEKLWLVGILENPVFQGDAWVSAAPSDVPITDITKLRKTLRLASGKGVSQAKGALGMSLQTPRALAPEDMTDILAEVSGSAALDVLSLLPAGAGEELRKLAEALAKTPSDEAVREIFAQKLAELGSEAAVIELLNPLNHLNKHEKGGALPCLCKACLPSVVNRVTESDGMVFERSFVVKGGRVLHFWAPTEVMALGGAVFKSVRAALSRQISTLLRAKKLRARSRAEERRRAREEARSARKASPRGGVRA